MQQMQIRHITLAVLLNDYCPETGGFKSPSTTSLQCDFYLRYHSIKYWNNAIPSQWDITHAQLQHTWFCLQFCVCPVAFLLQICAVISVHILHPLCTLCVHYVSSHRCLHQISMDSAALERVLTVSVQRSCIQRPLLVRMKICVYYRLSIKCQWWSSSLDISVMGYDHRSYMYRLTLEW
jgi:hypothetical protein